MNIFFLSLDPREAAQALIDSHVVKMTLESAQMLSTAIREHYYPDCDSRLSHLCDFSRLYRSAYVNHPCNVWLRQYPENFAWLASHAMALADEFRYRYGRTHKSADVIRVAQAFATGNGWAAIDRSPAALAMPDIYKLPANRTLSYLRYYVAEKLTMTRVTYTRRPAPIALLRQGADSLDASNLLTDSMRDVLDRLERSKPANQPVKRSASTRAFLPPLPCQPGSLNATPGLVLRLK